MYKYRQNQACGPDFWHPCPSPVAYNLIRGFPDRVGGFPGHYPQLGMSSYYGTGMLPGYGALQEPCEVRRSRHCGAEVLDFCIPKACPPYPDYTKNNYLRNMNQCQVSYTCAGSTAEDGTIVRASAGLEDNTRRVGNILYTSNSLPDSSSFPCPELDVGDIVDISKEQFLRSGVWHMDSYTKKPHEEIDIDELVNSEKYSELDRDNLEDLRVRISHSGPRKWKVVRGEKYEFLDNGKEGWNVWLTKNVHALGGQKWMQGHFLGNISSVLIHIDSENLRLSQQVLRTTSR